MQETDIIDKAVFNRQTILLVEDNEDDVFLMKNALRKAAVHNPVQVVPNGEQAVSYLNGDGLYRDRQQFPLPVITLLDLNMPKKNGLEVLEWIRQQPELKKLTVHILTASSRTVDVNRAAELGANAYLVKPSKVEELLELVKNWYSVSQFAAFPVIN